MTVVVIVYSRTPARRNTELEYLDVLACRAHRGDQVAVEKLFSLHRDRFHTRAARTARATMIQYEEVLDTLNDCLLRCIRKYQRPQRGGFVRLVSTSTRRAIFSLMRKHYSHRAIRPVRSSIAEDQAIEIEIEVTRSPVRGPQIDESGLSPGARLALSMIEDAGRLPTKRWLLAHGHDPSFVTDHLAELQAYAETFDEVDDAYRADCARR